MKALLILETGDRIKVGDLEMAKAILDIFAKEINENDGRLVFNKNFVNILEKTSKIDEVMKKIDETMKELESGGLIISSFCSDYTEITGKGERWLNKKMVELE